MYHCTISKVRIILRAKINQRKYLVFLNVFLNILTILCTIMEREEKMW